MPASAFMPEIEVAIAFPDGYTTPAASRTWTVVDDYVEADEHVKIDYGREDEHGQVSPSRLTLTLDNRDGRFTPEYAAGAHYPNVKKGRPIRVRARWPITTGTWYTLFVGYVDEWPVQWPDGTDAYSSVTITASSRQARLGRGATFKSIVEEESRYDSPVLYYPLGEPSGSTTAGNIAPGRTDILTVTQVGSGGTLTFGTGTGPGTDDLTAPTFTRSDASNGLYLLAPLSGDLIPQANQHVQIECWFTTPLTSAATNQIILVYLHASTDASAAGGLRLSIDPTTGTVNATAFAGPSAAVASSAASVFDGQLHHAVAKASLDSATDTVTATLILDDVATSSSAIAWPYLDSSGNPFFLQPSFLRVGGVPGGAMFSGTIAHVAVYTQASTVLANARFAEHRNVGQDGAEGEASGARVARYARLAGIPTAEVSTETGLTTSMAHKDTTGQLPIDLMQDVATTEDGLVFDARDGTLTFQARSHRYGSTSAFTLSCTAGEVEANLSPVLDDQGMVNEMTASRPNGIKVSPVNQASIDEYGYYRESLEVLTTSDNEVQSRADWAVNRFGTPRVKLTNISVDLINSSSAQITALLAADLGTRFTVSNLPAQAPSSSMQFFVEGITYDIGPEFFTVSFNTSAAAYADVWILDSASFSQLDSTTVLAY